MKTILNQMLRTVVASLCIVTCGQTQTASLDQTSPWYKNLSNTNVYTATEFVSIAYPNVDVTNGDNTDLCYRDDDGIICASSTGIQFGSFTAQFDPGEKRPKHWTYPGDFGSAWSAHDYYWQTIQYGTIRGGIKDDVCGFGPGQHGDRIYCALSASTSFGAADFWDKDPTNNFTTVPGTIWASNASYWKTIRLVDINNDGLADICGRGKLGLYCATSTGAQFGPFTPRSTVFSDQNGWNAISYWSTIQFADVNGDGWLDVCGRDSAGIVCAFNDGSGNFGNPVWTKNQFTDSAGWGQEKYYSTIHFADMNGDGAADVCGRGTGGFYCGMGKVIPSSIPGRPVPSGIAFVGAQSLVATEFSDYNGWGTPSHYTCLWLIPNLDGTPNDLHPAICGRGMSGIYCARSTKQAVAGFDPVPVIPYINNFADIYYWDTNPSYYGTVRPTHPFSATSGSATKVQFCGRGDYGIRCSNK